MESLGDDEGHAEAGTEGRRLVTRRERRPRRLTQPTPPDQGPPESVEENERIIGFEEWFLDWWRQLSTYPWNLRITLDEPIRQEGRVYLLACPDDDARGRLPWNKKPPPELGHDCPICFVGEHLTAKLAYRLRIVLGALQEKQGLNAKEGLAYLFFLLLVSFDHHCALKESCESVLLQKDVWQALGLKKSGANPYEAVLYYPQTSVRALLALWGSYRGYVRESSAGAATDPQPTMSFMKIPPVGLDGGVNRVLDDSRHALRLILPAIGRANVGALLDREVRIHRAAQVLVPYIQEADRRAEAEESLDSPLQSGSSTAYIFRFDGEHWHIAWEGSRLPLISKLVGLSLIHYLLQNEGVSYPARDLLDRTLDKKKAAQRAEFPTDALEQDWEEEDGLHVSREIGEPLDLGATEARRKLLAELKKVIALGQQQRQTSGCVSDTVAREIREIRKNLASDYGPSGRPRSIDPLRHKVQSRVNKALKVALGKIGAYCPALRTYLEISIDRRHAVYCYRPASKIEWTL